MVPASALDHISLITSSMRMYSSSVYVLLFSCFLLLSPHSASTILSETIHSYSTPDSGISLFPPIDGFQPPGSPNSGENSAALPPAYQGDTSGLPQAGTPNNGNIDFAPPPDDASPGSPRLAYAPPPSPPNDDGTPPSIAPFVPPPTNNAPLPASPQLPFATPSPIGNPLPTPQFPLTSAPPSDNLLPASPQLPFASPPSDSSLPESPQLPLASSPPLYNTLPGSPQSPLAYHHPSGVQPSTSIAPVPFGLYPSGQNQNQQYGQSNAGLFGQPQGLNDAPIGGNGEYGSCSSTKVNLVATAIALVGVLISWF